MRSLLIGLAITAALARAGWAQTPMEPVQGATVMELTATMTTAAGAAVFTVADQDTARSAVYNAWKYTTVLFEAVGDSVSVMLYVYGGTADRLPGQNLANDATRQFALMDSLAVTSAGVKARQVSDWMEKCRFFYIEVVGLTDNGHETSLERALAIRERY